MGGQDQRDASVRRERSFENQKRLGVIPKDTKLAPWPKDVLKPWDQLSADEKKLFIRQVDVFAAYNDHEIGRVVKAFEDIGQLDNTLVIYINGDNGTSAEGGPLDTPNDVAFFNGINTLPPGTAVENSTMRGAPIRPTRTCRPAARDRRIADDSGSHRHQRTRGG